MSLEVGLTVSKVQPPGAECIKPRRIRGCLTCNRAGLNGQPLVERRSPAASSQRALSDLSEQCNIARVQSLFETRWARFGAALGSGALLFFALGLRPVWWIAWIAPIPLLLAALHGSRAEARLLTAFASAVGLASLVPYYVSVQGPIGLIIMPLQIAQWIFIVSFTHAVVRRSDHWLTVFAYPLICSALDALISTFSPHGTFGSFAYTQMDALPVIQIASVGGTPAVVAVVSLFTSAVVLGLYQLRPRSQPMLTYGFPVLLLVLAIGYGCWRLAKSRPAAVSVPVGMVAIDDVISQKIAHEKVEEIWRGYDEAVTRLAEAGARIVVLPEKIDPDEPHPEARRAALSETARRTAVFLVVGVGLREQSGWRNRAWLFGQNGDLLAAYDKQHLVPGWEGSMTAGDENVIVSINDRRFGLSICKDMHFASFGRGYGKEGVVAVLEPAWDFGRDAWMAARIAALRGVENGYAVVHSARGGLLTASDRYGHFVAETPSSILPGSAVIAHVPTSSPSPTLYARFGGWFGWVCVGAAALLRLPSIRRMRGA